MIITLSRFKKTTKNFFLHEKKPYIAVGVSGGPDSIALVFLLSQWMQFIKGSIVALIIDHKIRKESHLESLETKKILENKGIKSEILSVNKKKVKTKTMIEARVNRFEKIIKYCHKNNIFHLFLGQHFDDNLETFLLRKIAGSNFEGLNSMQFITLYKNIQIIRPFLFYSKKDILIFNKKFKLKYINDPSNVKIQYSRVAVRQYLNSNKKIKNKVINDFKLIRKNYFLYNKMIYQILNLIIIDLKFKKIILDTKKFLKLNYEIKIKIIDISMKYVNSKSFHIRSKKIDNIINKMAKFHDISLQSQLTLVKKNKEFIIISKI